MKKYLLLLLSLLAIAIGAKADVEINSANFPDDIFRNYLLAQNYGQDGVLTKDEILSLNTQMWLVDEEGIADYDVGKLAKFYEYYGTNNQPFLYCKSSLGIQQR